MWTALFCDVYSKWDALLRIEVGTLRDIDHRRVMGRNLLL